MQISEWFRPPRNVLTIFLAVALICGGGFGVMAWLFVRQDAELETQRRQERAERLLSEFDRPPLRACVLLLTKASPSEPLLFYPALPPPEPTTDYTEAERFEFSQNGAAAAIRIYMRLGALHRVARVYRKLRRPDDALRAYEALAARGGVRVEGIPAGLLARAGRASLFVENGRTAELHAEAVALDRDLRAGRWRLVRSEFEYYFGQAREWLGGEAAPLDPEMLAKSEAAAWAWNQQESGRRQLNFAGRPLLVSWSPERVAIAAAEPVAESNQRRRLLLLVFGALGAVLAAGSYFILRTIARELRVARMQSDFVAAVSHEFRSPLSALYQISEMLVHDRLPTEELRRKSYDVLERETARLRRLVEGVLDFGKFEAGGYGYRFERIELCGFVDGLIESFEARVAADGYRVERAFAAGGVFVEADRDALSRALWNLLDNAVKYSPESRTVWVEVCGGERSATVTVRDQGIGIPVKEQREIFDKFVRGAESKRRSIKGTGIGLAMVRQIVRDHGGEVRVVSEPGEGSEFTVVLQGVS